MGAPVLEGGGCHGIFFFFIRPLPSTIFQRIMFVCLISRFGLSSRMNCGFI